MTAPSGRPAGLLLDLDGTLVLSERVHRLTWGHFFDRWGAQVDDREYEQTFMGRRASDVLAAVPGPWTGRDLRAIQAEMMAHAQTLGDAVEAVPGAAALIRRVSDAGLPVAVVTSAGPVWAEEVLGPVLGVRDRVQVLVTADDVTTGKPDPAGYLCACERLGVDAAGCTGVEDSPSGIKALLAAGVGAAVGVTTTSSAADLLAAGAHRTVADLRDPWLGGLVADR
ncbi:HAD family hydrolase [Blastococcus deserti]|uniref:HAD family hydrolase n=1 Tax=Blastococcus deserti TaxID=2259033 RepID=A0ABW4XI10_9ACTN